VVGRRRRGGVDPVGEVGVDHPRVRQIVTRGRGRWRVPASANRLAAAVTPGLLVDVEHADLEMLVFRSLRAVELATKPLSAETWFDVVR
jgi:hypothetical protein